MPDELFWRLTPAECHALLKEITDRKAEEYRAAALRAGLVTAAIYNVHRRKGTRAYRAGDFLKQPTRILTPQELEQMLDGWSTSQNARKKAVN